jgi:hypothetical protein
MKVVSKQFLRRREAGEKSIFWSSNKSHLVWADFHAQYVDGQNAPPPQAEAEAEDWAEMWT